MNTRAVCVLGNYYSILAGIYDPCSERVKGTSQQ